MQLRLEGLVRDNTSTSTISFPMAEITPPEQVRANSSAGHLAVHLEGAHPVDVPFLFEQPEKSFSWWDYRMLGYQKNRGLRIDHILVGEPLKAAVKSCAIDRTPRKWKQPSDHAPVTVELQ